MTPAREFLELAKEYCSLIDEGECVPQRRFVERLCGLVPRLYTAALQLPTAAEGDFELPVTLAQKVQTYARISDRIGLANIYWVMLDPYEEGKPGAGALSDDLGDTYWELSEALKDPRGEAGAGDWRLAFELHWGNHAAEALVPLHRLLVGWDHVPVLENR